MDGKVSRVVLMPLVLAFGHACASHDFGRSPSPVSNGAHSEWTAAQQDLASLVPAVAGDPHGVEMNRFLVSTEKDPFYRGETGIHAVLLVYGCFRAETDERSSGVIRYVSAKEGALRHEARHAILFALGDSRWPDIGH